MFRGILLVVMAEEEKKTKAAKKQAAKKKVVTKLARSANEKTKNTISKKENVSTKVVPKKGTEKTETPSVSKIYNDSKFTQHPNFEAEDLIKVLVRSPKETFVFWKFSKKTLDRITNELESANTDGLIFRLKVEYQNVFGSDRVEWHDLPPFTESYYLKFMFPVRMVQCTIFVSYNQKEIPSLHSTGKDLPQGTESFRLDKEWIHPQWIEDGLVVQSPSGEFYFRDENPSGYYVHPRNQSTNPNTKTSENFPFANGSGSGKGFL